MVIYASNFHFPAALFLTHLITFMIAVQSSSSNSANNSISSWVNEYTHDFMKEYIFSDPISTFPISSCLIIRCIGWKQTPIYVTLKV